MIRDRMRRSGTRPLALALVWGLVAMAVGLTGAMALSGGSRVAGLVMVSILGIAGLVALFARDVNFLYMTTFALLPFVILQVPGLGLPVCEILIVVSFAMALTRPDNRQYDIPNWVAGTMAVFFAFWIVSLITNGGIDLDPLKRVAHIGLWCGVILAITSGLIPRRVIQRGLLIGLIINCFLGLAVHFSGQDKYAGRLGGFFGDPNVFGFYLLVLGAVALENEPAGRRRQLIIGLFGVCLALSLSRGSLLALAVCIAWVFTRRRLGTGGALVALGSAAAIIFFLPTSIQTIGPFGGRSGSDTLREAVLNESIPLAKQGFIHGVGPGRAFVNVYDRFHFLFHNSFLALVAESGIGAMISYMALLVGTFVRLIRLSDRLSNPWFESALIAGFFCALHLGEVLVELPMAVAIGCGIHYVMTVTGHRRAATSTRSLAR